MYKWLFWSICDDEYITNAFLAGDDPKVLGDRVAIKDALNTNPCNS